MAKRLERELSVNSPNFEGQRKVYTRWIQFRIQKWKPEWTPQIEPEQLVEAFKDGVILFRLMQSLCEHPNVGVTESELSNSTGNKIRLQTSINKIIEFIKVTIRRPDIIDGTSNMVMGLIWLLILAFQHIIKDAQMSWVKDRLSEFGVAVTDLSNSFRDGMAFASLVYSFDNSAFDMDSIQQMDPSSRLKTAFTAAEERLQIPQLLDPSDFEEKPDERMVMTYLSFFHNKYRVESGEVLTVSIDGPTPPVTPTKAPENKDATTPPVSPTAAAAAAATVPVPLSLPQPVSPKEISSADDTISELNRLREENAKLHADIAALRDTVRAQEKELSQLREGPRNLGLQLADVTQWNLMQLQTLKVAAEELRKELEN